MHKHIEDFRRAFVKAGLDMDQPLDSLVSPSDVGKHAA